MLPKLRSYGAFIVLLLHHWHAKASAGKYPLIPVTKCFNVSQGTVDRSNVKIRVARRDWLSAQLAADAFAYVMKEVMNYDVEVLDVSSVATVTWGVDMEADLFDFELESWQASEATDRYAEFVVQKQLVAHGKIGYGGRSGMFSTPKALTKEPYADWYQFFLNSSRVKSTGYCMFGEKTCEDSIKATIGDKWPQCTKSDTLPFCGAKGSALENYYVPPECSAKPEECALAIMAWPTYDKAYFEQLTTNHKLKLVHTWVSGKEPDAVQELIKLNKEVYFYWWVPDPFPAKVKAKRISFPDYAFGCDGGNTNLPSGPVKCDYPPLDLAKLARSSMRTKAPEAFYVWQNFEIYMSQIEEMISSTTAAGGTFSAQAATCAWLKANKAVINTWAPPCVSSPKKIIQNGDLVFDPRLLTCQAAALYPEYELKDICWSPKPGMVDRSDKVLKIADRKWDSQTVSNFVAAVIAKAWLGYTVVISNPTSSTSAWGPDMNAGAYDFDAENWQAPKSGALYKEWIKEKGVVLNPGTIGYEGRSGLFLRTDAVQADPFAAYYRFYDNPANAKKTNFVMYPGNVANWSNASQWLGTSFPKCTASWCPASASDPFYGYWVPPQCQSAPEKCALVVHAASGWDSGWFEQLARNLGLYLIFAYYHGGGAKAYGLAVKELFAKTNKATIFYGWTPDMLITQTSATRLSFPDFAYACDAGNNKNANTGPLKCDYGAAPLQKLVRAEVATSMPEAYMFLKNLQIFSADMNEMLTMHKAAGGPYSNWSQVACWWGKKNEDRIKNIYAPECISSPKATSQLKAGDRVFDAPSASCPAVSCKKDEVLDTKGAVSCRKCPPGQAPNKDATDCSTCPIGNVPDRAAGNCTLCPKGHKCNFEAELPEPCQKGEFADKEGSSECSICEKGRYQPLPGQGACVQCSSPMTTGMVGSRSAVDCICPEKYYKPLNVTAPSGLPWTNHTTVCKGCPKGMTCEEGSDHANMPCNGSRLIPLSQRTKKQGGLVQGKDQETKLYPVPPAMFFSSCAEEAGLSCFKCLSTIACPGGDVETCGDGTEGISCGRCQDGYYKTNEACKKCNDIETSNVIFPVLPAVLAPCGVVFLYLQSRDPLDKWNAAGNYMSAALFVILVYIQTLASISACYLAKPTSVKESNEWSETTTKLMSMLRPACTTFGNNFQVSFIGQLLLPVYALVVFIVFFLVSRIVGTFVTKMRASGNITCHCYFALFNTFFIGICQQAFSLFQCYSHPNGEYSMRSQGDVLCRSDDWNDLVIAASVAVTVFCGGFLALNTYIVIVAPRRFADQAFQMRFKFVFIRYRPSVWWWGLVMLIKAIWLNLPTVLFDNAASQTVWLQTCLILYFATVYALFPWRSFMVGALDVLQHAVLVYLFGFVSHFVPVDDPGDDEALGLAYAFFSMLPIGIGVFVMVALFRERVMPPIRETEWTGTAERLCETFKQVNDPQLLAKILGKLPWSEVMVMNTAFSLLQTTYLFDMKPNPIMRRSSLLKIVHSSTRLQAEREVNDYMGDGYSNAGTPTSEKKVAVDSEKDLPERTPELEETNGAASSSSKQLESTPLKDAVKVDDIFDALDFPEENSHPFKMINSDAFATVVTPRIGCATTPRSMRGNDDIAMTPRSIATPRSTPTPRQESSTPR